MIDLWLWQMWQTRSMWWIWSTDRGRRWFDFSEFLYDQTQTVPSQVIDANSIRSLLILQNNFLHAQLHFSHFIKVHKHKAIDISSLLLLTGQGRCSVHNQPTRSWCYHHLFERWNAITVVRNNADLILVQIMNNSSYSTMPQQKLFNAMDPYDLVILERGIAAVPLIKIVLH